MKSRLKVRSQGYTQATPFSAQRIRQRRSPTRQRLLKPHKRISEYDYNLAKQLVAVNRPDGVTVEYLYEGDNDSRLPLPNPNTGRLKKIVQPRGDTTFGYDTVGRLSNITAPDGGLLSYAYDGSLLLSTTWSNGEVNGSVSRTYDNNFWVTSESVNGANTVGFTYDLDGLLSGANTTVNGSAVNFTINRDAQNGLITGSSIGGVADSISYNGFAEPIGYTATFNGTNTLYDVSYVRDAIGRITSKTETVNGVTTTYGYHYDLAGRLTGVDKNGVPSSTYTYDSNGNRLSYTKGGTTLNGTYDTQDRLLSYGDFVYEYTANGELRRKENVVTGEVWEYSYDAYGNLMWAKLPNGTLIEYVVDAQDRRIGKKVNGQLVGGYLYRGKLKVVAETDAAGNVTTRFAYGEKPNVPETMYRDGKAYRIITDQIGSVRLVIESSSGSVVQQIEYDEFGNVTDDTNRGFQPFGYAGGLYDQTTGLVRFGARDYDPVVGRWTLKDPIGFNGGDPNLYAYASLDPINIVDPTGKIGEICGAGVIAYYFVTEQDIGKSDKKKHCELSCQMAKTCGKKAAWRIGVLKEYVDWKDDDPKSRAEVADLAADLQGIGCSDQNSCPKESCSECCAKSYPQ